MFCLRKLGQLCTQTLNFFCRNRHSAQIGLRKKPVILCVLFAAHGLGSVLFRQKAQCFLLYALPGIQNSGLPPGFVCNCTLHKGKRIHVFNFGTGSQLFAALGTKGNIYVAAQRTFLHFTIGNTQITHGQLHQLQIFPRFLHRAEIRLCDDLNEWYATAVIIHQRAPRFMYQLACILLQMDTFNADHPPIGEHHPPIVAQGDIVL